MTFAPELTPNYCLFLHLSALFSLMANRGQSPPPQCQCLLSKSCNVISFISAEATTVPEISFPNL